MQGPLAIRSALGRSTELHYSPSTSDGSDRVASPSAGITCADCSASLPTWDEYRAHRSTCEAERKVLQCQVCREEFQELSSLQHHFFEKHGLFATAPPPPMSVDVGANGDFKLNLPDSLLHSNGQTASPPSSSDGQVDNNGKVFNAEAYCEICKKEFCNKYFLKTHKANKHGIQVTPTSSKAGSAARSKNKTPPASTMNSTLSSIEAPSWSMAVSGNPPTMVTPRNESELQAAFRNDPSLVAQLQQHISESQAATFAHVMPKTEAFCPICQQQFPNAYVLQSHFFAVHNPLTTAPTLPYPSMSDFLLHTMAAGPQPFGPPLLPPLSTSAPLDFSRNSFVDIASNMPSLGTKATTPGAAQKVEAFCELCQKEFCNKYFLRTHKFNKHGIVMPETPQNTKRSSVGGATPESATEPSPTLEQPLQATAPGASEEPRKKKAKKDLSSELDVVVTPSRTGFDCGTCGERFRSAYDLALHGHQYHGSPKPEIPEGHVPTDNSFLDVDGIPPGVDPEAYCEFCRKEFCSKYFLKTHKLNIHNINMDLPTQVTASSGFQPVVPQGLLSGLSGSQPLLFPSTTLDAMTLNRTTPKTTLTNITLSASSGKNFCDICNKELCNKYFLRTHMAKMHGLRIDENKTVIGTADQIPPRGCHPCDICGKELSSKHFLKMHRSNTHGISDDGSKKTPTGPPTMVPPAGLPSLLDPALIMNQLMPHLAATVDPSQLQMPPIPLSQETTQTFQSSVDADGKNEAVWERSGGSPSPHSDGSDLTAAHSVKPHFTPADFMSGSATGCQGSAGPYREICGVCNRRFKSVKWLRTHMWTEHGSVLTSGPQTESDDQPQNLSTKAGDDGQQAHNKNMKRDMDVLENGQRIYRCAYCSYSSRWLSNLCVHEKRHTGGGKPSPADPPTFTCNICLRSYRYQHSLQRHMACHRFANAHPALAQRYGAPTGSALLERNGFRSPAKSHTRQLADSLNTPIKCSPCSKRFRCLACQKVFKSRDVARMHFFAVHRREPLPGASPRKVYRCKLCGHATRVYDELRQHLIQLHKITPKSKGSTAKEQDEPAPLNLHSSPKKEPAPSPTPIPPPALTPPPSNYIMQPFVMRETTSSGAFVSSMVYLPVCREVKGPIEASFSFVPLPSNAPLPYPFA